LKLLHVHASPNARTVQINLRIQIGLLDAIKRAAVRQNLPYQRLIKVTLHKRFLPWKPRSVKCGGPGCSPYGSKNWKGPKPTVKKIDMRIDRVELDAVAKVMKFQGGTR